MIIFGGILELTKELNEMLFLNYKTELFTLVGNENHVGGLNDYNNSSRRNNEDLTESSPVRR